jgi:hypothetical protein
MVGEQIGAGEFLTTDYTDFFGVGVPADDLVGRVHRFDTRRVVNKYQAGSTTGSQSAPNCLSPLSHEAR